MKDACYLLALVTVELVRGWVKNIKWDGNTSH